MKHECIRGEKWFGWSFLIFGALTDQRVYSEIQWKYQRNNTSEKSYRENKVMEKAWGRSEGSTDQDWPFTVETTFGTFVWNPRPGNHFGLGSPNLGCIGWTTSSGVFGRSLDRLILPRTDSYEKASNEKWKNLIPNFELVLGFFKFSWSVDTCSR